MPVARSDFIAVFPEFADVAKYPEAAVTYWLTHADATLPADRFGAQAGFLAMLSAAHNLVLGVSGTAKSGTPGLVASKSIDKVSVSYDLSLTASAGGGPWNATTYGQRFYALLRGFATGPIYRAPLPRGRYAGLGRL